MNTFRYLAIVLVIVAAGCAAIMAIAGLIFGFQRAFNDPAIATQVYAGCGGIALGSLLLACGTLVVVNLREKR